ncbi:MULTISPECIES: MarR family transcriptional regulator [unclassified Amycolatopsis]|uniref:MarR family transcriptional regulator n=1 Tax=Amycolatopsis orientalis subsp. vinearia TaxID=797057 RepID=A0A023GXH7_AMYOR|nr:MarR family transcriptional regulator [Amycolatopsis sp. FBCC-B4732]AFO69351.1 MarR family transcriptional regulator [Amycolatopsis orientalis subsp. vinearia]UOX93505.1 MarR family transcriptional regulator [Amycolatopsis sp. FBCC-B4732]
MTEKTYPVTDDELFRFAELGRQGSTLTVLRHARIAERMGLSGTDHKTFDLVIQSGGPLTAGRIAELTGLSTGAVTGVIDRLEKVGLVSRVRDPEDRRKVLVAVVPGAEERFAPLFESAFDALRETLAQFSPVERKAIERYQNVMLEQLRAEILDNGRPA